MTPNICACFKDHFVIIDTSFPYVVPKLDLKNKTATTTTKPYLIFNMFLRPDPVKWTKDGGKLPDLDRMIVDGRELTFISLNKTDNGTYRCEASNHLGTNHAEYVLFVYGEC